MIPLILGLLLVILLILKAIAVPLAFLGIGFFVFINDWFVWLFAGLLFLLLYSSNKHFLTSALISAGIGLIMRFVLKV